MSATEELAAVLTQTDVPTYVTGTVTGTVDATHVSVDIGHRTITATVPENLANAVAVNAFVRVSILQNDSVLDSILAGMAEPVVQCPIGAAVIWFTSTIPSGFLIADGSTFSSATYPALYAVLGTTTLPDLRGRIPVGKSASGTLSTLGATGGEETVLLEITHLAAHTHEHFNHTHTIAQHTHKYGSGTAPSLAANGTNHGTAYNSEFYNTSTGGPTLTGNQGAGTGGSTGGNTKHNNLQPYRVTHYIIRAR